MREKKNLILYILLFTVVFGLCAWQISRGMAKDFSAAVTLPAGFPTNKGMLVIWAFLCLLWAVGSWFVFGERIQPKRKRNVFLNMIIFVMIAFMWCWFVYHIMNFPGAIALAAFLVILALILWLMFLVTHRYGGYLFTPVVVWSLYTLYLSIALLICNKN